MNGSQLLIVAALMSFVAALLHIAIIFVGASWYRLFGAGEQMARLAEEGSLVPGIVTLGIAMVLIVWGLYALSGANLMPRLPFLSWGLCGITLVLLVRGVGGLVLPFVSDHPSIAENSTTFWVVSSLVCLTVGTFYLLGTISAWEQLAADL